MALDPSQFRFRTIAAGPGLTAVVLTCLVCGEPAYGSATDPIGDAYGGAESDDDLDTVLFQADEHQSMYCKGAPA